MRTCPGASNTTPLSFSRRVPQRSADFVERHLASRSVAESFSEPSATAPAEFARSPFSVLKTVEHLASGSAAESFSEPSAPAPAEFARSPFSVLKAVEHLASRSAAESFSEPSAPAPAEFARSPFSVLKAVELAEDAPKPVAEAKQVAASGVGQNLWTKYPRVQTPVKPDSGGRRSHEPATGFELFPAALRSVPAGSLEAGRATGCEPSLFLVGQVRPFVLEN
jgi:hypothetical protein